MGILIGQKLLFLCSFLFKYISPFFKYLFHCFDFVIQLGSLGVRACCGMYLVGEDALFLLELLDASLELVHALLGLELFAHAEGHGGLEKGLVGGDCLLEFVADAHEKEAWGL